MSDVDPLVTLRFTLVWTSAVDPSDVTSAIGLAPTEEWRQGDARVTPSGHRFPTPREASGWQLQFGPRRTIDMPGVVAEFVDAVGPIRAQVRQAVVELGLEAEVSLHIKLVDQAPVGTISRDAVALINEVGAELDLDLYVVDETYDEPFTQP